MDRLLRKLGFRMRPPYYQGFFSNFCVFVWSISLLYMVGF
ncbi:DUF6404 family protein [Vibrio chagasii]|nr:DUF6404 family protein [Vibrio chagasii]